MAVADINLLHIFKVSMIQIILSNGKLPYPQQYPQQLLPKIRSIPAAVINRRNEPSCIRQSFKGAWKIPEGIYQSRNEDYYLGKAR